MPVDSQTPVISYNGNGATLVFAFGFAILDEADLYVKVNGSLVSTGYSVSGVGDPAGGAVTFVTAPASGTGNVVLYREVALERQTDYQESGDLLAATLDADIDRIWHAMQDRAASESRALRAPFGETLDELPAASSRALRVQGYDADGQPVMLTRTDDGGAALALDMLDADTPGKGAEMMAVKGSLTGEVKKNLSASLNLKVKGLKKNFGASLNGTDNDYSPLQNACQADGKIIEIEDGTCLYNTAISAPTCEAIVGWGSEASFLKMGASVAEGLSITGANAPTLLRGFTLLGNAVNNARGIVYGKGALTANVLVEQVAVRDLIGTGAIGAYFRDIVLSQFVMTQYQNCSTNMRIEGQTLQPTTLAFVGGVTETSLGRGLEIISVTGCEFVEKFTAQANAMEGIAQVPNATNALGVVYSGCWLEGNYGADTTKYQFVATTTGAATNRFTLERGEISGSVATAKAIKIDGAFNSGWRIIDTQVPNLTGQIYVGTGGYGRILLPGNLTYDTVVDDALRLAINDNEHLDAWTAWTPTYSSSSGNAATTYTGPGTVTTASARWKKIGKTLNLSISFSATLNAVTPTYLVFTLPNSYVAANNLQYAPAAVKNGATYSAGAVINPRTDGTCRVYLDTGATAFGSGNAIEVNALCPIEIA